MADTMKLTEKSLAVFNYVKANGGKVSTDELASALDRAPRSISPSVTDLAKKGLVVREKVEGQGEDDKAITYVILTDAGKAFVQPVDAE